MSVIQTPRFNRRLQRLLSILDEAPASQLAAEIVPALVLENDRPEAMLLGAEQLAWGRGQEGPGGVGTQSSVILQNPVASGAVIVVESARPEIPGAGTDWVVRLFRGEFLASPTVAQKAWRDTRGFGVPVAAQSVEAGIVGQIRGGVDLAEPTVVVTIVSQRSSLQADPLELLAGSVVLGPGSGIKVQAGLNAGANCCWIWRERALEDLEA